MATKIQWTKDGPDVAEIEHAGHRFHAWVRVNHDGTDPRGGTVYGPKVEWGVSAGHLQLGGAAETPEEGREKCDRTIGPFAALLDAGLGSAWAPEVSSLDVVIPLRESGDICGLCGGLECSGHAVREVVRALGLLSGRRDGRVATPAPPIDRESLMLMVKGLYHEQMETLRAFEHSTAVHHFEGRMKAEMARGFQLGHLAAQAIQHPLRHTGNPDLVEELIRDGLVTHVMLLRDDSGIITETRMLGLTQKGQDLANEILGAPADKGGQP